MENNTTSLDTPAKREELPLEKVLLIIQRPLMWCLFFCNLPFIVMIICFIGYYRSAAGVANKPFFGELNVQNIPNSLYVQLYIVVLFVQFITYGTAFNGSNKNALRRLTLVVLSTLGSLIMLVNLSGGILESPQGGALAIYITGYLIINDRQELRKINRAVLAFSIVLILLPYGYLKFFGTGDLITLLTWNLSATTTFIRICLNIFFMIVAAYYGHEIDRRLNLALEQIKGKP